MVDANLYASKKVKELFFCQWMSNRPDYVVLKEAYKTDKRHKRAPRENIRMQM